MPTYNVSSGYPIIVGEYPFHKELKEEVVPLLENHPDEMNRRSNVKATMTNYSWGFENKSKRLQRFQECMLAEAQPHKNYTFLLKGYRPTPSLFVKDFWANIYYKGDYAIPHDHTELLMGFSFAYFLKSKWYHSPFIFTDSKKKIKPKEGTYVIFPSHMKHHVPHNRFKETRITLSGNILTVYKEGMIKQP